MISLPLYKREMKGSIKVLLIFAAVITLYVTVIIRMYDPEMMKTLDDFVKVMPELMAAVGMHAGATSLIGFMISYLYALQAEGQVCRRSFYLKRRISDFPYRPDSRFIHLPFLSYRCAFTTIYIEPMIGISVVDTTDTAFSFTDLATITKYDTIISTAITQSERHMKLDSPLTSTFFFCSAVIVL